MTTRTERNYWMRRVAAEKTDTAPIPSATEPAPTRADILEEALYALMLIVIWILATVVIAWKTVMPGGSDAILTFLILEGMYTTCVILAWVKTR